MAKAKVSQSDPPQKSDQQQPLGNLIAAVLADPDCPQVIHDGIVDAVNELLTSDITNHALVIQAVIVCHKSKQEKGGAA